MDIVYLITAGIVVYILWLLCQKKPRVHYIYGNCKGERIYTENKAKVTCKNCLKKLHGE